MRTSTGSSAVTREAPSRIRRTGSGIRRRFSGARNQRRWKPASTVFTSAYTKMPGSFKLKSEIRTRCGLPGNSIGIRILTFSMMYRFSSEVGEGRQFGTLTVILHTCGANFPGFVALFGKSAIGALSSLGISGNGSTLPKQEMKSSPVLHLSMRSGTRYRAGRCRGCTQRRLRHREGRSTGSGSTM